MALMKPLVRYWKCFYLSSTAASVDECTLKTLSREDLQDLFPGPENFLRRRRIWDFINENSGNIDQDSSACSEYRSMPSTTSASPCQLKTSTPTSDEKKMKMPDPPEYVVYTDSELDLVRAQYFALLRSGKERGFKMSKELCCRLIRNTITSMVAILRASPMGKEASYPSKLEMKVMSQKIIEYYPMLRDTDPNMPHLTVYTKMFKRLQNMRSPCRKRQGPVLLRGPAKTLFSEDQDIDTDLTDTSGSADTVILESSEDLSDDNCSAVSPARDPPVPKKAKSGTKASIPSSRSSSPAPRTAIASPTMPAKDVAEASPARDPPVPKKTKSGTKASIPSSRSSSPAPMTVIASPTMPANDVAAGLDSLKMQARHYKTLSNMYNKPNAKPNQNDVAQILDLEFEARRAFIDSDVTKEEDRPAKILDAYPCFKDVRNAMDELRRIVDGTNRRYIEDVRGRWTEFCTKVQFYSVWKKVLKPPFPLDVRSVDFTLALFNALPPLFPSSVLPPKKLACSEALIHILKSNEDPALYLQKRPLSSPVLLFDGSTTIVAVGNVPVTTLKQEDFSEGMLVLMAYYYTLHLTYPKCVATLLSVIQTEVIGDALHDKDATSSYKKAMAEWNAFIEK
ncbi:uncharacterized protein LOC134454542 isoform X1 [Engraulis encrasicolus]|uniref:uncharacterized protein LOC134454542 isoform X1 n=3 Tax=Engraulis encrasicolus TaxID=184585 RepID=UPI002FCE789F